ncbi:hypothetical protein I0C86_34205 [Plantactinospora sp. S1510]|uniref:Uncharacterized protein n=1 Tax=Plantactinospora alkalitolerans TaxID=2789879 RepID=A0ABS0H673_9ACTN|nr:hypothetical protein [Plantactinospora alkalitolerans]
MHDGGPRIDTAGLMRDWMTQTRDRFAYRCLPMLIANQSGWLILNDAPFTARWTGGESTAAVTVDYDGGEEPRYAASHFGYGILTWTVGYLFRTPPGFNLHVRGPANYLKDAIQPLEGVVEADWASAPFTMNWRFTRRDVPVRFEADEPICMIHPVRRADLEQFQPRLRRLADDPEVRDRYRHFQRQRGEFLATQTSGTPTRQDTDWEKHYLLGVHADGERTVDTHQRRRLLDPFVEDG